MTTEGTVEAIKVLVDTLLILKAFDKECLTQEKNKEIAKGIQEKISSYLKRI